VCALALAAWDTDDNGAISRREFGKAMASLGLTASAAEMTELFDAFDADNSGFIDYHELEKVCSPSLAPSPVLTSPGPSSLVLTIPGPSLLASSTP
jgi:hypothetical protein